MSDANERTVAELQKKLDETKSFARMHIQNFKSQAKAHADELADAKLRATDAISAVNVSNNTRVYSFCAINSPGPLPPCSFRPFLLS
jgi:predicted transcriptional regulator